MVAPVVRATDQRFSCNMISAVSPSGGLHLIEAQLNAGIPVRCLSSLHR